MHRPLLLALGLALSVVAGCGSTQTATEHHSAKLEQTPPGTPLEQFRETFPKATLGGQKTIDGTPVDAYVVKHSYVYDQNWWITEDDDLWFYFAGGRLVNWGGAGDWPTAEEIAAMPGR